MADLRITQLPVLGSGSAAATDPLAIADFEHYCTQSGYEFLESYNESEKIIIKYKFKI